MLTDSKSSGHTKLPSEDAIRKTVTYQRELPLGNTVSFSHLMIKLQRNQHTHYKLQAHTHSTEFCASQQNVSPPAFNRKNILANFKTPYNMSKCNPAGKSSSNQLFIAVELQFLRCSMPNHRLQ